MRKLLVVIAALPLLSGGCVAQMAYDLATLPVRAGAKAVDLATVSQRERDEHYSHKQRKVAERRKEQDREARKRADKAAKRDRDRGVDSDLS